MDGRNKLSKEKDSLSDITTNILMTKISDNMGGEWPKEQ